MNRAVSINLRSIGPGAAPAREGRLRLLVLTMRFTGLRSFASELEAHTAGLEGVDATHVIYAPPLWVKALSAHVPGIHRIDYAVIRTVQAWALHLGRWLRPGGPLDLRGFDAIVCTSQFMGLAAARLRERSGCRVVTFGDSTTRNNIDELGFTGPVHEALARLERRLFDRADLLCFTGRWAIESARRDYDQPEHKLLWVPPTADERAPVRTPGRPGPRRIIFIGNNFVRKGGDALVRLHQERWKDRAELHVCSSEARPDASLRNVVFHGRVPRERLVGELLPSMDLFVMPTRQDQSCWPAVEAQMAGVVPVVPRVGGIPDLVEDGSTGFLTPLGDDAALARAVESVLDEPARLEAMSERAASHARAVFGRSRVMGRLLERVGELAGQPRPSGATGPDTIAR